MRIGFGIGRALLASRDVTAGPPAWLLAGSPTGQIDFGDSRAWLTDTAYTSEASIKALFNTFSTPAMLVLDTDGKYRAVDANSLHSFQMTAGKCRGQSIWEARTNKCTNHSANPLALVAMGTASAFNAASVPNVSAAGGDANTLFGIVDDSTNISSSILSQLLSDGDINGRVYRVDNTSGASFAYLTIGGTTGNTNPHVVSIVSRGTGNAGPTLSNSTAGAATTAAYSRQTLLRTPSSSINTLSVRVEPGAEIYFILTQLEEGSIATPPIIVTGATAARAASSIIAADGSDLATVAQGAKSVFVQTSNVGGGSGPRMLEFGGTAILNFNSSTVARAFNGSAAADATIGSAGTYAGTVKSAFSMDATSFTSKANGGTQATQASAWAGNTGNVYFGDRAAQDRTLNGYLNRMAFWPTKGTADGLTT